jgi:hypothetical protein
MFSSTIGTLKVWVALDSKEDCTGYTKLSVRGAGYTKLSVTGAGYTRLSVRGAGYTRLSVRDAGYTRLSVRHAGYTKLSVTGAGYTRLPVWGARLQNCQSQVLDFPTLIQLLWESLEKLPKFHIWFYIKICSSLVNERIAHAD